MADSYSTIISPARDEETNTGPEIKLGKTDATNAKLIEDNTGNEGDKGKNAETATSPLQPETPESATEDEKEGVPAAAAVTNEDGKVKDAEEAAGKRARVEVRVVSAQAPAMEAGPKEGERSEKRQRTSTTSTNPPISTQIVSTELKIFKYIGKYKKSRSNDTEFEAGYAVYSYRVHHADPPSLSTKDCEQMGTASAEILQTMIGYLSRSAEHGKHWAICGFELCHGSKTDFSVTVVKFRFTPGSGDTQGKGADV